MKLIYAQILFASLISNLFILPAGAETLCGYHTITHALTLNARIFQAASLIVSSTDEYNSRYPDPNHCYRGHDACIDEIKRQNYEYDFTKQTLEEAIKSLNADLKMLGKPQIESPLSPWYSVPGWFSYTLVSDYDKIYLFARNYIHNPVNRLALIEDVDYDCIQLRSRGGPQ